MSPKKIFYLTVVFWLLIFSGIIVYKEYTLRTGTEVVLKTVPVDPRDLFRGDYVVLNYEISTLDLSEIPAEDTQFWYNDRIYLALEIKDGYGVPKKIYKNPPEDELYIKGKVTGILYEEIPLPEREIIPEEVEPIEAVQPETETAEIAPSEAMPEEPVIEETVVEERLPEEIEISGEEITVDKLIVEYGIESYFVPEGRGLEIESERWEGKKVDVAVVIDRFGNAVIRNLLIDGEKVEF
ncbi:hypothetical protein FTO70_03535 [Methanosarcina sp. KYL-1]|uniref:GDYXXLXY domain-containing protein n=1 Tax=Methanosarcina sp. KYL-1 TaxID=2602068 RepID=UPI002101ACA5|nr:GDYXXLXY domain-containing protein [Methanosarcina sp. KYL-1]MCQ1534778.1 hypothetical protein [Methanosarcina sp. KYL-1]